VSTISPEQASILERLITTAAQASAVLKLPLERTERFVRNVYRFLEENEGRFGEQPFLLALADPVNQKPKLTLLQLISSINAGRPVLYVDEELHVIDSSAGEAKLSTHCALTKAAKLFGIVVHGIYVWEILEGIPINEGGFGRSEHTPPVISRFHRPIEQFKALVNDHLDEVLNRDEVPIWNDKGKRILSSVPEKTELIFHRSLFVWLRRYVSPKLKVYAEPLGLGQDKTDIIVVTNSGSVVIEVKWLGVNQNSDEYKQPRIDEGLAQVKIYLNNDDDLTCGHLVCYDGRSKHAHDNESTWNDSLRHLLCTEPLTPYLSTDQPSKQAKKIAKGKTP